MFKFTKIPGEELDKLREIRQGNTLRTFDLIGGQAPTTFTFPHDSYTLDVSNLFRFKVDFKPFFSGKRVIEATADHFRNIYDLNKTEEGLEPQIYMDNNFLKTYEWAFNQILGSSMEDENYEVRILKIPALHQEALWLHNGKNPDDDKFLPVKKVRWETNVEILSKEDFLKILTELNNMSGGSQDNEIDGMLGG